MYLIALTCNFKKKSVSLVFIIKLLIFLISFTIAFVKPGLKIFYCPAPRPIRSLGLQKELVETNCYYVLSKYI